MRLPAFRRRYCHLGCINWLGSSVAVRPLACSHIRSGFLTLNVQTELLEALMLLNYISFCGAACLKLIDLLPKFPTLG